MSTALNCVWYRFEFCSGSVGVTCISIGCAGLCCFDRVAIISVTVTNTI